jgi:hypothetical protein
VELHSTIYGVLVLELLYFVNFYVCIPEILRNLCELEVTVEGYGLNLNFPK